jgi:hypothetical protein
MPAACFGERGKTKFVLLGCDPMPMPPPPLPTDENLFASLPGGQAVIDWFGFCPVFHDATLERLELSGGSALLSVRAHRMTSKIDENGFYILDRHASVTLRMRGVTGVRLEGDAGSIISELLIRRLQTGASRADWQSCAGPVAGNIEVMFDTSIGLCGSIFAKELAFELQPLAQDVAP